MWEALASLAGGWWAQEKTDDRLKQQMDFQREMSNTAYQRSMADMRKAGLNPMLAYSKGGASTPSGAFAPASDILTPAVSTAMAKTRLNAEVENMQQTNENLKKQNANLEAENKRINATTGLTVADTRIKNELWQVAIAEAKKAKTQQEFNEHWVGKLLNTIGMAGQAINPLKGMITVKPTGQ